MQSSKIMRAKKGGCREPDAALNSVDRFEGSFRSYSPGVIGALRNCSSKNISIAVIEVTCSRRWQQDVTAKWNKYGGAGMPKCVAVYP